MHSHRIHLSARHFTAALGAPADLKNSSQDMSGNIHIPQLEAVMSEPTSDDWYDVSDFGGPYVSLPGIPVGVIAPDVNSTFTLETSYLTFDCNVQTTCSPGRDQQLNPQLWNATNGCQNCTTYTFSSETNVNLNLILGSFFKIRENLADHAKNLSVSAVIELQSYYYFPATVNRIACEQSVVQASCPIRTTYVEAAVECQGKASNCTVIRLRRSVLSHPPETETVFECITYQRGPADCPANVRALFFAGLMNSVPQVHSGVGRVVFESSLGNLPGTDLILSRRCWTSNCVSRSNTKGILSLGHVPELAKRQPYVPVDRGNCMEDGTDTVRRARHKRIQLGDVTPLEDVGHVAIAIPGDDQPVKKLNKRRLY